MYNNFYKNNLWKKNNLLFPPNIAKSSILSKKIPMLDSSNFDDSPDGDDPNIWIGLFALIGFTGFFFLFINKKLPRLTYW